MTACTTANKVDVQRSLDAWINRDTDSLVRAWGLPDRSYDFKDHSQVLEYERNRVDTYGGLSASHSGVVVGPRGTSVGIGFPLGIDEPTVSVRRCTIKFEADRHRIIRTANAIGPNCAYALINSF